jgi:cysteine-rich repeat protein
VPGYGSGVLGRFDPAIERWKVYPLPTGIAGPPGYGNSEEPYALNANRQTGDVWITGSASDTLIRFDPTGERFSAYPVPTRGSFMREIIFDPDGNPWTCTSDEPAVKEGLGRGKFVKIELPPKDAVCGDGIVGPGEQCDDGNTNNCDGCSNACTLVTGCGDGVVCGTEQCDDGNTTSCDGCSATCTIEQGFRCGDGVVDAACGEQCDPPGPGTPECNYQCQLGPAPALGTRHFSFGGSSYSSALGTSVPFAALRGAFDLIGGSPGTDGVAQVTMSGPSYYTGPILGGAFGTLCFRLTSCTGTVDCVGQTAVGVQLVQDSAGPGVQGNPVVATTGLGGPGGPGAVLLTCQQSFVQLPPGPADCSTATYPPDQTSYYTTGQVEGHFLNGNPRLGTGEITVTGQDFSCTAWATEEGPGQLATGFLVEEYPQAGDTANANVLVD